jgi:hypothetical protein
MRPFNLDMARETYLVAMLATSFAGRTAVMVEIAHAAKQVPPAHPMRPIDQLLDGLALVYTGDPAAAAPLLGQVVTAITAGDMAREEGLRWAWVTASLLWDDDAADAIIKRQVQLARQAGALDQLPIDLLVLANSAAWSGDLTVAADLVAETSALCEMTTRAFGRATGSRSRRSSPTSSTTDMPRTPRTPDRMRGRDRRVVPAAADVVRSCRRQVPGAGPRPPYPLGRGRHTQCPAAVPPRRLFRVGVSASPGGTCSGLASS